MYLTKKKISRVRKTLKDRVQQASELPKLVKLTKV